MQASLLLCRNGPAPAADDAGFGGFGDGGGGGGALYHVAGDEDKKRINTVLDGLKVGWLRGG